MPDMNITYVNGSMIVTHPTGVVETYNVAQLNEEKNRLQDRATRTKDDVVEIDNHITNASASLTP